MLERTLSRTDSQERNVSAELQGKLWSLEKSKDQEHKRVMVNADASRYLLSLYDPTDRIAVVGYNKEHAIQRITTVSEILKNPYQKYLMGLNREHGYNISHGQAVLKPQATGRKIEDIAEMKTLWVDIDKDGPARLAQILGSADVPRPTWILQTSPGKYQLTWKVNGFFDVDEAGRYMRGLTLACGGDPQAVDLAHTTRMPGFTNVKPEYDRPRIELVQHGDTLRSYSPGDFQVRLDIERQHWRKEVTRNMGMTEGATLDYQRIMRPVMQHLRDGHEELALRSAEMRIQALGISDAHRKAQQTVMRAHQIMERWQ